MPRTKRDPRTKEDFLDRILRFDFEGDIRQIGAEPARIERTGANSLRLTFPASDAVFDLTVHRPRETTLRGEGRSFAPADGDDQWTVQPEEEPAKSTPRKRRPAAQRTEGRGAQN